MQQVRFKILVSGDESVGKTSLVRRFVSNTFSESYKATLGFEISVKNLVVANYNVTLSLWDIGGQPFFADARQQYYQNGQGFLLAFDLTNRTSFDHLSQWLKEIHKVCPTAPIILIVTKADLEAQRKTSEAEIFSKAQEIGAIQLLYTSAKTGEKVEKAFQTISEEIINGILAKKKATG